MLGALVFSLTKARGYVDPDDSLLVYFMLAGFAAWLLGLTALFLRYAPASGGLGKTGLGVSLVGILALAVGHLFSFTSLYALIEDPIAVGVSMWSLVVLGVLSLIVGPFLFGISALRMGTLPRRWRFVPLVTGGIGLLWLAATGSEDGSLTFGFMFFRTLFALGWFLMGYALFSDKRESAEKLAPQET